jgi:hypothetical protein
MKSGPYGPYCNIQQLRDCPHNLRVCQKFILIFEYDVYDISVVGTQRHLFVFGVWPGFDAITEDCSFPVHHTNRGFQIK